jgi:hypothetical protein
MLRRWMSPFLIALAIVFLAMPAHALIGTPTSIGSNTASAAGTTLAISATAAVPAGNTVIVTFTMKGSAAVPVSCTDSKGNTYSKDADSLSAGMRTVIFSATVTNPITTSPATTITITHPSVARRLAGAFQVSGITPARFDKSSTATGNSNNGDSGLTTPTTQANELLIGSFGIDIKAPIFSVGTNYTALGGVLSTGALGQDIAHAAEYRIVNVAGAYAATATVDNSNPAWSAGIATYKATNCGNSIVESGETCDLGAGNGAAGTCCSATCSFSSAGSTCRASTGGCDPAETCDGASVSCPADVLAPNGTVCRAAIDACDFGESCDGIAAGCPADLYQPDGTACGSDADPCTTDLCSSGACTHVGADTDGDTVCDFVDNCDTVGNLDQLDTDTDNIGDACECLGVTCPAIECNDPGTCDSSTGACQYTAQGDGTACDDGDACSTDDVCAAGVCQGIGACGDAHVRLPASSSVGEGDEVVIPVVIDPATGVIGAEIAVTYDPAVLTPTGLYRTNFTNDMTLVPNLSVPGSLSFVLFGPDPLAGTGQVVWIVFQAIGGSGTFSALTVTQHDLNEGIIPSVVHNGIVSIAGVVAGDVTFSLPDTANGEPGSIVDVPITVDPSDTLDTFSTTVLFNPSVVQATSINPTVPTAGWSLVSDLTTPGTAILSMSGPALSGGPQDIATISFSVTGGRVIRLRSIFPPAPRTPA